MALFTWNQSEKQSKCSSIFTSLIAALVTKTVIFLTLGSHGNTWLGSGIHSFSSMGHSPLFGQMNAEPFDHFKAINTFGLRPWEASSDGFTLVCMWFHWSIVDKSWLSWTQLASKNMEPMTFIGSLAQHYFAVTPEEPLNVVACRFLNH